MNKTGSNFLCILPWQHGFVNKVMEKPFTVILLLLKFSVKSEEVKFETKRWWKQGGLYHTTILRFLSHKNLEILARCKVIHTKYSKHWPYTVAHTIDCVCIKMLNHGLNHGLFLSLFKLIPCHIHWIVYVLAYLNFIFEF